MRDMVSGADFSSTRSGPYTLLLDVEPAEFLKLPPRRSRTGR
jgi:hypothetical protein